MVTEFAEYQFRIIGPKPETVSMARLAVYMAELAKLLGSQDSVHFDRLEDRSLSIFAHAEPEKVPLISPRIRAAATGDDDAEAASSWRKINEALAEDGWTAELPLPNHGQIIIFPGKSKAAKALRSVTQPTSIQGRLIRLEGSGDTVSVGLDIDGDLTARVSIASDQAPKLAQLFHRNVRLSGDGRWKRSAEGKWSLDNLAASAFEVLEDGSLTDALDRLKEFIPSGTGAKIIDAVNELRRA